MEISIIIPVFNQLKYTKQCVRSIKQNTRVDYELIVIDNGSTDGTEEFLRNDDDIICIHNKTNLGYAKAINQGIAISTGKYLVLLNNDCIVTHEWITRLLRVASKPNIGIVGVMSNYAQYPQLFLMPGGNSRKIDDISNYVKCKYDRKYIYVRRVLGFCMLIKRELVRKIGGFDETFGMGYFEDDDYSLRSIMSGYKNVVAKDVFVFHYGSITFKNENIFKESLLDDNWKLFKNKWGISDKVAFRKNDYLSQINLRYIDKSKIHIPLRYRIWKNDEEVRMVCF